MELAILKFAFILVRDAIFLEAEVAKPLELVVGERAFVLPACFLILAINQASVVCYHAFECRTVVEMKTALENGISRKIALKHLSRCIELQTLAVTDFTNHLSFIAKFPTLI